MNLKQETKNYRVESYESVDSTNSLALDYARSGDKGRLWVIAEEQFSGRGRRGRTWVSSKGNLYATLLLVNEAPTEKAALLGFVAGVSLAEAINELALEKNQQSLSVKLKWPNDILLNDAKVSGILLEMTQLISGETALVIGIGLNVAHCPTGLSYAVSSLHQAGLNVHREEIFTKLCQKWVINFTALKQPNGEDIIRKKWLSHAANLGGLINTIHNGTACSGVFETLDDDFRCILRQDNGDKIVIQAGDVYFGTLSALPDKME